MLSVTCKTCGIRMQAGSEKAIRVISDSMCKLPDCPCKTKTAEIIPLLTVATKPQSRKERKAAERALAHEKRLANLLKREQTQTKETPPKDKPEPQVYWEFDPPISEHMML